MAFPVRRFVPTPVEPLRLPPELTVRTFEAAPIGDHDQAPALTDYISDVFSVLASSR
jgi:hypothetical protein